MAYLACRGPTEDDTPIVGTPFLAHFLYVDTPAKAMHLLTYM